MADTTAPKTTKSDSVSLLTAKRTPWMQSMRRVGNLRNRQKPYKAELSIIKPC